MIHKQFLRYELRSTARLAIAAEVSNRIAGIDKEVCAALRVLGYEHLDDMVNEDLSPEQRKFFKEFIDYRVMLVDIADEADTACRAITEGHDD